MAYDISGSEETSEEFISVEEITSDEDEDVDEQNEEASADSEIQESVPPPVIAQVP